MPRRQVFVEATILEISVDKTRKLGVAWHGGSTVGTGSDQSLLFGGSEPSSDVNSILFSPAALSGLAAGLRGPPIPGADDHPRPAAGHVDPELRRVRAGAAEQRRRQRRVDAAHPHHRQREGDHPGRPEPAVPRLARRLPRCGGATGAAGAPGATFGLGTSVQRQDVALKLEITPHVNDSDFVRLEIDNEISDVSNPNFNGLGPATTKRTVKSVVTIRDQQSIVLGGLIKDRVSETVNKVPLLGDIPILGYLFK